MFDGLTPEPWWRAHMPFLVVGGCIVVGALFYFLWPSGRGALSAAQEEIDAQRARVCPLLEQLREHRETPDDLRVTGEPLRLPGFVFIDSEPSMSHIEEGSNADAIEERALRALCSRTAMPTDRRQRVFTSVLADLGVSPDDRVAATYDPGSVEIALEAMRRTRWLLVERVVRRTHSRVSGGALVPGSIEGDVTLFRLDGAERFGSLRFAYDAPSTSYVYARTSASDEELSFSADVEANAVFESRIVAAFASRGVELRTSTGP
jgi:hypothetical protein